MSNRIIELEATLRLALEALDFSTSPSPCVEELQDDAIAAIKAALEAHKALMSQSDGAQPSVSVEKEPVAIKHMTEWVDYLKRKSDYGQHLQIPSEMSAGACWELALELEQFINTTPPPVPEAHKRKPLTDAQLEKGREQTFSINNPFCPCDSKTFRKVARWVEAAHDIKE